MRNFRKLNSGLGLAIIALAALTVAGCGASDAEQKPASAEQSEEDHGEEGGGHIEMTAAERSVKGIKSIALGKRQLTGEFIAPGEVTANRYKTAQVAPRISAQIVERHIVRGEKVEEGAPLVTLSSVEMAEAQGALIINDKEWRRVRNLGRDVVSEKRFVEADVARQQAHAKLLSFGMAEQEVAALLKTGDASKATGRFLLFAPQAGTVVRDDFTLGEFVDPGRVLVEISDETTVWVEARLTAEQAQRIAVGAAARVKSSVGHWEEGKVIQLQHALDETTRTLMARIEIGNADDDFHAGQFVDAAISVGAGDEALALPESAVVLMDGAPTVFRIEGDEIEPVSVETGAASGGWIEIASGVAEGDEIVTEQTFLLKSLIQKTKMGEGHGH
ncbi:efflux RND transporter periplasmic adaptor subunit [Hyphococcus sp.]|uniref:efflux RND transporter periplasmic adaptor subunit n=1 Tax=Hyphococcus sp. TaxID=2038636 RepID=UPI003D0AB119